MHELNELSWKETLQLLIRTRSLEEPFLFLKTCPIQYRWGFTVQWKPIQENKNG